MNTKEHDTINDVPEDIQLPSKKKVVKKVKEAKNEVAKSVKRQTKSLKKDAKNMVEKAYDGAKDLVSNVSSYAQNSKEWMMDDKSGTKKLVAGAIIGGAVGCIAATMIASRNNKSLADTCKDYSDKFKSMLENMGSKVSDTVHDNVECASDKAHDVIMSVKSQIGDFPGLENSDFKKGLIVGAALGGLLGSGSTLLYNKISSGDQAKDLTNPIDWKAIGSKVLQLLDTNHLSDEFNLQKAGSTLSTKANDVLDFAQAGIQLWKNLKGS